MSGMLRYLCATGTERILDNSSTKKPCSQITFLAGQLHLLLQDSCGVDSRLDSRSRSYWCCVTTYWWSWWQTLPCTGCLVYLQGHERWQQQEPWLNFTAVQLNTVRAVFVALWFTMSLLGAGFRPCPTVVKLNVTWNTRWIFWSYRVY